MTSELPLPVNAIAIPEADDPASFGPLGVGRNSLQGPAFAELDLRWSHEFLLEKGFDPAGAHASLEVVISGDGGRISGAATGKDQKAQPGVTVVAVSDQPLRWISERSKSASTDQNGRFNIQGLRPGRYHLYAFEEIEPGAYDDPQFMKRYLDRGKTIDITENSQQMVDLTMIPKEENQ